MQMDELDSYIEVRSFICRTTAPPIELSNPRRRSLLPKPLEPAPKRIAKSMPRVASYGRVRARARDLYLSRGETRRWWPRTRRWQGSRLRNIEDAKQTEKERERLPARLEWSLASEVLERSSNEKVAPLLKPRSHIRVVRHGARAHRRSIRNAAQHRTVLRVSCVPRPRVAYRGNVALRSPNDLLFDLAFSRSFLKGFLADLWKKSTSRTYIFFFFPYTNRRTQRNEFKPVCYCGTREQKIFKFILSVSSSNISNVFVRSVAGFET